MWCWMRILPACTPGPRTEKAYPPGWPNQALALSARLGTAGPDIVTLPDVAALPPGEVKDMLAAAGVRAWACVPLIRPGRVRGIMGFDAFAACIGQGFPPACVAACR